MNKVLPKPGIKVAQILKEFSKAEIEGIYPALSPIIIQVLCEELELLGYLKIEKDKAEVTSKGEAKLKAFKKSLSKEDKTALKM